MAKKITSVILLVVYVVTYLGFMMEALFGVKSGDEMGFALLAFYIVMPFMSLVCGTVWGLFIKSRVKWLFVFAAWILEYLLARVTFASNDPILELVPACLALFGLLVGESIRIAVMKDKKKKARVRLQA